MPRRYAVRHSPVHGRGVFATADLPAGEHLLTYAGEIVDWDVARQRWEDAGGDAGHTFFFDRGDGTVVDGGRGGNAARFVNHGCTPNCETVDDDGVIRIVTLRVVAAGEELLIDYRLTLDDDAPPEARDAYACRCGSPRCRTTMLVVADRRRPDDNRTDATDPDTCASTD